jgi:hypothetical protein
MARQPITAGLQPAARPADNRSRGPTLTTSRSIVRAARPAPGFRLLYAGAILALALARPGVAHGQDYPRLGLYGAIAGDGYPYIVANVNGALQDTTLNAVARYHEVVLDASPISEYRNDVLAELRARRPGIKLLAYVTGHTIWNPSSTDSFVHFPTRYYRLVRDLGGWLYNTDGEEFSGTRVNLAKRDLSGRFVVAESVSDLFYDAIVSLGIWDGIFIDIYCKSILWMESPTEHIDFARAGYPSLSAFDAAWAAAIDTLGDRLRRRAGPSIVMVGNCAQSTNYGTFNGWMRENFPFQNGGDWYQNMFRDVGGYFADDLHFRAPRSNYLFSAMIGSNPYSATNLRRARFGLASAALGSGYAVFGPSARAPRPMPYHMYWYDEYGVDLTTGRSSPNLAHTGWLGQPLGPYSQIIWLGSGQDAVVNPDFETDVATGWNFNASVPATLARDASTAAVGSASAHVTVSTASSVTWAVAFNSTGALPVLAYQPYSATFWARASAPRNITVAASTFAETDIPVTTAWSRYQVTLVPQTSGSASVQFFLAETAGDVWIDDVHFQPGVTNVYRRDFQNGIVLVNPASQSMTVDLGRDYRKILGTLDPATNDGSTVTQTTVPPSDALFLIGDDRIAPSAIMDLQPGPAWTPRATRAKSPAAKGGAQQHP